MTKNIALVIAVVGAVVIGLGMYRFNATNEDIYVENPDGDMVKVDEAEEMAKDDESSTAPTEVIEETKDPLLAKLMTGATIKLPGIEPETLVSLSGQETNLKGYKAGEDDLMGGVIFGERAMPYPYYKDETGGPDAVTTLTFNFGGTGYFTYLTVFTPGEASWQQVDMLRIGDNASPQVSELKVVEDEIIVIFKDETGEMSSTDPSLVKRYTVTDGKLVEKK